MNGAHVAFIGEEVDLTYPVEQLGSSPSALGALLKVCCARKPAYGQHLAYRMWHMAQPPCFYSISATSALASGCLQVLLICCPSEAGALRVG